MSNTKLFSVTLMLPVLCESLCQTESSTGFKGDTTQENAKENDILFWDLKD